MTTAKNPIGSVKRSLDIIDILQDVGGAGVTEIADRAGVTKGTAHCHLATLEEYGYVVKQNDEYRLGLRFLDVAHHCRNRTDIYDIARTEVNKLARESGEIALFLVEENDEVVVLYKSEGENAVQTKGYAGHRDELYRTAAGKAMLAHMPEEKRDRIVRQSEFQANTPNTISSELELRDELEQIREAGIAYNREESIQGLVGVSAPIQGQDGTVHGAISVMGPVRRMEGERLTVELPEMVRRAINIIEINITSL